MLLSSSKLSCEAEQGGVETVSCAKDKERVVATVWVVRIPEEGGKCERFGVNESKIQGIMMYSERDCQYQ